MWRSYQAGHILFLLSSNSRNQWKFFFVSHRHYVSLFTMRYIWKSNLHTELNIIGFVGVNLSTNGWKKFSRIEPNKKFVKQQNVRTYRVSKKLSFTDLSIFRFAKNIISISSQLAAGSSNAQFGKTQFFLDTLYLFVLLLILQQANVIFLFVQGV